MKSGSSLLIFSLIFCMSFHLDANAQQTKQEKEQIKEAEIRDKVEGRNFTIIMQMVIPLGMESRELYGNYGLRIKPDTIESNLPYFGTAYTAGYGNEEGSLEFKTSEFEYKTVPGKKQGWTIKILPKKAGDTRQMLLTISSTGFANLQVTCSNRQAIAFNGYLE